MKKPDEKLLKPCRDLIAKLGVDIATAEHEVVEKMRRLPEDDDEGRRRLWLDFHGQVEPMRRQRDAIIQQVAGYLALFPPGPITIPC